MVLPMVLPTWVRPLGPQVLTSCFHGSKDLDLSALRQQILSSKRPASEKADSFLLERSVNDLSKDQWQNLIVGIPKDVKKEIGMSKSAGTQLDWRICLVAHHILL